MDGGEGGQLLMRILPGPHLTSVYTFLEADLCFREKSMHTYDVLGTGKENIQGPIQQVSKGIGY